MAENVNDIKQNEIIEWTKGNLRDVDVEWNTILVIQTVRPFIRLINHFPRLSTRDNFIWFINSTPLKKIRLLKKLTLKYSLLNFYLVKGFWVLKTSNASVYRFMVT